MASPVRHIAAPLNTLAIRRDFPVLQQDIGACPLVYFDNAASSQRPTAVLKAMDDVIHETVGRLAGGQKQKDTKLYGKMVYNQLKKSCRDY
ncbi:MAG: hypothetical protein EB121_02230, partial [Alphaproteobacteria bacterium]|nr:hypothetical protein [Alphaproteobacteria bacterium]